jgi:hypothetical protein
MSRISITGGFTHSMTIIGWFAELWITVRPTVGTSVFTRKYVCEFGPVTVELRMVGLYEVNRNGMNFGEALPVANGRAPNIDG